MRANDVPESVSQQLKVRAAAEGRSLWDYALQILEEHVRTPAREVILARLAHRPMVNVDEDPVITLRRMRDA